MTSIQNTHCCGAFIYEGISRGGQNPEYHLRQICEGTWRKAARADYGGTIMLVMFDMQYRSAREDDADSATSALALYVQRHKLGTVDLSEWTVNPNSGNYIRTATWIKNMVGWKDWCDTDPELQAHKKAHYTEDGEAAWGKPVQAARMEVVPGRVRQFLRNFTAQTVTPPGPLGTSGSGSRRSAVSTPVPQDSSAELRADIDLARLLLTNSQHSSLRGLTPHRERHLRRLADDIRARQRGHRSAQDEQRQGWR